MADEKTLRVSIDGSGAKSGADQVVDSLQAIKGAATEVGESIDRTQSVLTQAWKTNSVDTYTGSLANLSNQVKSTIGFLQQGQSALTQGWSTSSIDAYTGSLTSLSNQAKVAIGSLQQGQSALTQAWKTNSIDAYTGSLSNLSSQAQATISVLKQGQSALVQGWNPAPINSATSAISQMGQSALNAVNGALKPMAAAVSSVVNALGQMGQAAGSSVGSALRSLTSTVNSASGAMNSVNGAVKSLINTVNAGSSSMGVFAMAVKASNSALNAATTGVQNFGNWVASLNSKLGVAGQVFNGIRSVLSVMIPVDLIKEGAEAFFEATNRFQGFLSTMTVVAGSTDKARDSLKTIFDLANKYGVDVTSLTNSFAKLSAAAKGTSLEGDRITHVFESVVAASSAMHLSTQDTTLVLYALQQMVSKGTISMEELRRQMAERFPGAMQIAAESMLMTNSAFQKMVSTGKVATADFVNGFADAIMERFLPATEVSANSLLAAVNRMHTAWEKFLMELVNSPLTDAMKDAVKSLQNALDSLSAKNVEAIGNAFALGIQYVTRFIESLDSDKINKFAESGVKYVELIANMFGLLMRGLDAVLPQLEKITKRVDDFYDRLDKIGGDGTGFAKTLAAVLATTGNEGLADLVVKFSNGFDKAVETSSFNFAESFEGAFTKTNSDMDGFNEAQRAKWDQWGDQVERSVKSAHAALVHELNFYDDGVARMMRQVPAAKAQDISQQNAVNDQRSVDAARADYDVAKQQYDVKLKLNDVQSQYNAKLKEYKGTLAEIASLNAKDPGNNGRLTQLYKDAKIQLGELLPLQKEKMSMDKQASRSQDEFTNALAKFKAGSESAKLEYEDLSKGLDKLVPAERDWIHLQETAQYAKWSDGRKALAKAAAEQDIADQKALATLKEFLTTMDHLSDKNDKASAALDQQIVSLRNGEKATHGLAVAEFDRNVALLQANGVLDKLRATEGDLVDKKLASGRASAEAKDRLTEYLEVTKAYVDASDKEIKSLNASTERMNERAQTLTITKEQQDLNTAALRESELAQVNAAIAVEEANADDLMYLETLYKKRDALKANVDAFKNMSQAEAAKNFEKTWVEAVDKVSDKFSDFLQTGINQGWSAAFKQLWSDFESWGLKAIAKIAIQRVAVSIFPQLEGAFAQGNNGPLGAFGTMFGLNPAKQTVPPVDTSKLQTSVNQASAAVDGFASSLQRNVESTKKVETANDDLSSKSDLAAQNLADFGESTQSATSGLNTVAQASQNAGTSVESFAARVDGTSLSTQNLLQSLGSVSNDVNLFGTSTTTAATAVNTSTSFMRLLGTRTSEASRNVSDFARSASDSVDSVNNLSSSMDEIPNDFTDFSGYVSDAGNGLNNVAKSSDGVTAGFGSIVNGIGGFLRSLGALLGGLGGSSSAFAQGGSAVNTGLNLLGGIGSNTTGSISYLFSNILGGSGPAGGGGYGMNDRGLGLSGANVGTGSGAFGVGEGGLSFGGVATGAVTGLAIGGISSQLFGNSRNQQSMQTGGAIGGAIGSIWGPIGSMVGSLIGSAIGSLFKSGGGPKQQGAYLGGFDSNGKPTGAIDNGPDIVGITGDNQQLAKAQDAGTAIANSFFSALTQLGGKSSGLQIGMGFSTDPQGTAPSFVHTVVRDSTGNAIFQQNNDQVGRDDASLQAEISLQAQRAVLAALQSSDLPKYLTDLLNSVDASTASADDIQKVEDTATAIAGIVNQLGDVLPNIAEQLQTLDPTQLTKFVEALGGSQKALSSLSFVSQNFTTSAQRAKVSQNDLTKAWDTAGVTMDDLANAGLDHIPQTHEEFMKLLDSLDLNTDHGKQLAASLINDVAPAFVAVKGSADAAAEALNSAAQQGIDYYNQHFLTPDQQKQQRIGLDETTLFNATKEGTKLNDVLKELNLDVIPTTREGVQALVNATLAKYGADSNEYKQLMALIPVIGDLNDATNSWGDSASNAADQATAAAEAISRAWGQINEQNSAFSSKLSNLGGLADQAKDFGTSLQDAVLLYQNEIDALKDKIQDATEHPTAYNQSQLAYVYEPQLQEVQKSLGIATSRLNEFTKLSSQYGSDKAEQLFKLEEQYHKDLSTFAGNNAAVSLLTQRFNDQWAAIVNGAEGAASSIDDFIKSLNSLVDSSHGTLGQRLAIQLAASFSKVGELFVAQQKTTPGSAQFQAIQADIDKMSVNNVKIAGYMADFTTLSAQYGDSIADQLVALEQWRDEQKDTLTSQIKDSTQLGNALTIVDQIFAKEFQGIIDGSKGAGNALDDLKQKIRDFIDGLKTSDLSPLTPQQKLQAAQDLFASDLAKAKGGDTDAMGKLTDEAQDYLKLARDFYASSQSYTDIFNHVVASLAELSNYQSPLPSTTVAPPAVQQPVVSPVSVQVSSPVSVTAVSAPQPKPALTGSSTVDYTSELEAVNASINTLIDVERSSPNYTDILTSIANKLGSAPAQLTLRSDYSKPLSDPAQATMLSSMSEFDKFMAKVAAPEPVAPSDFDLEFSGSRSPLPPAPVAPPAPAPAAAQDTALKGALPVQGERIASNQDITTLAKVVSDLIKALADNDTRNAQNLKSALEVAALRQRQAVIDSTRK